MQTELISKITNEKKDQASVLVLNFESIFCNLLVSVSLVTKNWCKAKVSTKTKTMTLQTTYKNSP